jgi:hypothetical protein
MGRPLSKLLYDKTRYDHTHPFGRNLVVAYANINGYVGYCWILQQTGTNSYQMQSILNPTQIGPVKLTNGSTDNHGDGYIGWATNTSSGFVAKLDDKTLTAFSNIVAPWQLYFAPPNVKPGTVYVYTNSNNYGP